MLSIEMFYRAGSTAPDLIGGKELVEALMSGKYLKGTGQLAKLEGADIRYCCLGLKCKLDNILTTQVSGDMTAKYSEIDEPCALALPEMHPWTMLFGQELGFPEGFVLNIYRTKNGNTIKKAARVDAITKVNDYFLTDEPDPSKASFSFTTVAAVIQTAWNCLPELS